MGLVVIVVHKHDGTFVTFLDAARGGVAHMIAGGL